MKLKLIYFLFFWMNFVACNVLPATSDDVVLPEGSFHTYRVSLLETDPAFKEANPGSITIIGTNHLMSGCCLFKDSRRKKPLPVTSEELATKTKWFANEVTAIPWESFLAQYIQVLQTQFAEHIPLLNRAAEVFHGDAQERGDTDKKIALFYSETIVPYIEEHLKQVPAVPANNIPVGTLYRLVEFFLKAHSFEEAIRREVPPETPKISLDRAIEEQVISVRKKEWENLKRLGELLKKETLVQDVQNLFDALPAHCHPHPESGNSREEKELFYLLSEVTTVSEPQKNIAPYAQKKLPPSFIPFSLGWIPKETSDATKARTRGWIEGPLLKPPHPGDGIIMCGVNHLYGEEGLLSLLKTHWKARALERWTGETFEPCL